MRAQVKFLKEELHTRSQSELVLRPRARRRKERDLPLPKALNQPTYTRREKTRKFNTMKLLIYSLDVVEAKLLLNQPKSPEMTALHQTTKI
jgi:hypothetical protein